MRQFILGTDWWTDCDDAIAVRLLARAYKADDIRLLGIGINACMDYSVASLDGFLHLEGVTDIPLGIDLSATDFGGNPPYQARLTPAASRYTDNNQAEDAVQLYRRLLAESEQAVEILEIGYPQVLADLLESPADDLSDKSGIELVREKVAHVWVMAGKWNTEDGLENNFCRNPRSRQGGERFCRLCPVPVTFLGFEVGESVISGSHLASDDHLHLAMADHGSGNGRSSWDPMLVLLALAGDPSAAGYDVVCGIARVNPDTGANRFTPDEQGQHRYVVKNKPDDYYRDEINRLIATR